MTIELIVLLLDSLYPVEEVNEGFLERLSMPTMLLAANLSLSASSLPVGLGGDLDSNSPLQLLSRLLAEIYEVFARSPRTHGPHITWWYLYIYGPNGRRLARHDHGAAALPTRELRPLRNGRVDSKFAFRAGRRVRPVWACPFLRTGVSHGELRRRVSRRTAKARGRRIGSRLGLRMST
jgi:hypothetical protein